MGEPSDRRTTTLLLVGAAAAAVVVGYYAHQRYRKHSRAQAIIDEYRAQMQMSVEEMHRLRDDFEKQMMAGLTGKPELMQSLRMLPSMVDVLPSGHENGTFYAIDVGGTNFRVISVHLTKERGKVGEVKMRGATIPEEMKKVPATELFDYIAQSMVKFAHECEPDTSKHDKLVAGFCFSFPVNQTSLDSGSIIAWTKGFDNKGGVGADPVALLSAAFKRQGTPVRVAALLNDTVGVLSAGRYADPEAMIGVIQGTGTNACYVEKISRIKSIPVDKKFASDEMVINMEWGNYTSSLLPFADVDRAMDESTVNRGEQHFEKLTSGMYMGEIARRIVERLAVEGGLFGGAVPLKLTTAWSFSTPQMSAIDSDHTADLSKTGQILHREFGLPPDSITLEARQQVQQVCRLVAFRAAQLVGTAIAGLLRHMGRDMAGADGAIPKTIAAVDGSVFEKYEHFRNALKSSLRDVVGPEVASHVEFKQARDGSGLGAAFLAASAVG